MMNSKTDRKSLNIVKQQQNSNRGKINDSNGLLKIVDAGMNL